MAKSYNFRIIIRKAEQSERGTFGIHFGGPDTVYRMEPIAATLDDALATLTERSNAEMRCHHASLMMGNPRDRKPAGFDAKTERGIYRADRTATIAAAVPTQAQRSEARMGEVGRFKATTRPTSSIWGPVDHAIEFAPGIWKVDTAGHGGYMLSPERVMAMPDMLKPNAETKRGNFEEDCDWALVALAFPHHFTELNQYYARNTIKGTASFSFPGFNAAPWLAILDAFPVIQIKDMTREGRIALFQNEWRWNHNFQECPREDAERAVDSGIDLAVTP